MAGGLEPGDRRRGGQPGAAARPAGQARVGVAARAAPGAPDRRGGRSSATERVHAKVLDAPQRSVWASLEARSLPTAVTTGAFRRLRQRARAGRRAAPSRRRPPHGRRRGADRARRPPDHRLGARSTPTPTASAASAQLARDRVSDAGRRRRSRPASTARRCWRPWDARAGRARRRRTASTPERSSDVQLPARWTSAASSPALGRPARRWRRRRPARDARTTIRRRRSPAPRTRMLLRDLVSLARRRASDALRGLHAPTPSASTSTPWATPTTAGRRDRRAGRAARLSPSGRSRPCASSQIEACPFDEFERNGRAAARDSALADLRVRGRQDLPAASRRSPARSSSTIAFAEPPRGRIDAPALGLAGQARPADHRPGADRRPTHGRQRPAARLAAARTGSTTCGSSR